MGLSVFQKGLILVAVPMAIELLLIISLALLLLQSDRESIRELKYRQCAALGTKLVSLANEAVIAMFGCYHVKPEFFLRLYDNDRRKIDEISAELLQTSRGDRLCRQAAKQLVDSLDQLAPLLDQLVIPAREGKRILEASMIFKKMQKEFGSVRELNMQRMSSVSHLQEKIAENSAARYAGLQKAQFQILLAGLLLNMLVGAGLLIFFRRSIFARLKIIMENTTLLADGHPLNKSIGGSDEIAQLDAAFHHMDEELKAAAERERSLFENANEVICVLNSELEFLRISPACKKNWGYDSSNLCSKSLSSIIAAEQSRNEKLLPSGVLSSQIGDFELLIEKSDGSKLDTLWSSYFSEAENKLYCIVHDLSEQKQVERGKQAFISMLSRDLKEPLLKIAEDLEQLIGPLSSELNEETRSRIESLRVNIQRLLGLVNDLLTVADSGSKKLKAAPEQTEIEDLLLRATKDLEGMSSKRQIGFKISCKSKSFYADRNRIMQVLVNLGSNAIKFSPAGSEIELEAADEGDFVLVNVWDRGRGVPESYRESIFLKYSQVEHSDGKRKAGTGLGLPICKEIIEESGGQIGVSAREGGGSRFWFRLPSSKSVYDQRLAETARKKQLEEEALSRDLEPDASGAVLTQARMGGSKLSLMKKGLLLIGIPIAFELIFVVGITALLVQTEKSRRQELHERQLASEAYRMLDAYFNGSLMMNKLKTYENWLFYDENCSEIIESGEALKGTIKNDKQAAILFAPVEKLHDGVVKKIEIGRKLMAKEGYSRDIAERAAVDRFELWARSAGISRRLGRLIDESQQKEFINPERQLEIRKTQAMLLACGLLSNLAISLFLARFFSKDITSRLAMQADNAARFARGKSLNPPLSGSDEIARLDRAFHATAGKLAEARKKERAIFDNSQDMVAVLNAEGHFLSSNPASQRLLHLHNDTLRETSIKDLLYSESDKTRWQNLIGSDLSGGDSCELRFLSRDGRIVHTLVSVKRANNEENLYLIAHDITDRKELEQMKEEFLAVVSHDLRSPLTSIAGTASFIEMGASGEIGAAAKTCVANIVSQAEQLIELINDLLDLEKIQAGKMELSFENVSASDLLEAFCGQCESKLDHIGVDILDQSNDPIIFADAERLMQAMSSLLMFAGSKASNGSIIKVTARVINASLIWQIQDPESKSSPAELMALFEKTAGKTSKLSLPLCKSILSSHRASLDLHPAPGSKGMIYQVTLPLANAANAELNTEPESVPEMGPQA